jgi:hypothetical protein
MPTAPVNPAVAPTAEKASTSTLSSIFGGFEALFGVLFVLFLLLGPSLAAAKLSYDRYQSIGWAILDFFFAVFYIPYYAFFLNTSSAQPAMGGRHRRR